MSYMKAPIEGVREELRSPARKNWKKFVEDYQITGYQNFPTFSYSHSLDLYDHNVSFKSSKENVAEIFVSHPHRPADNILVYLAKREAVRNNLITQNCEMEIYETGWYNWRVFEAFVVITVPKIVKQKKRVLKITVYRSDGTEERYSLKKDGSGLPERFNSLLKILYA